MGALWGVWYAGCYSGIAVILYIVDGPRRFEANDVSLLQVLALYWIGGVLGGAILGLLRPLAHRRLGAMLVGSLVIYPSTAGVMTTMAGSPFAWSGRDFAGTVVVATLLGSFYAWWLWEPPGDAGARR